MRKILLSVVAVLGLTAVCMPFWGGLDAQEKKDTSKPPEGGKAESVPAQPTAADVRKMLANIENVLTSSNSAAERQQALVAMAAAPPSFRVEVIAMTGFNDSDKAVRIETCRTLGAWGPLARDAGDYLADALGDSEVAVRREAAAALIQIFLGARLTRAQQTASRVAPALRRMVKSEPDPAARRSAVAALTALGPAAKRAVPELLDLAKDERAGEMRTFAILALGAIGPDAKKAAPYLMELARKDDKELGGRALAALSNITPDDKAALAFVMDLLQATFDNPKLLNEDPLKQGQREGAASALGNFGPAAEPAVPLLMRVLEAKDIKNRMVSSTVRRNALFTLREIGPGAKAALPIAAKIANDPGEDGSVREEAKGLIDDLE